MQIEVKLQIESTDAEAMNALRALMDAVEGTKAKTSTKPRATKKVAPKAPKTSPAQPEPTPEEPTSECTVTLDGLRGLVRDKVQTHRTEIKAKLEEFGAGNVSSLDKSHYEAFNAFLTAL